jgi:hypothetical protein
VLDKYHRWFHKTEISNISKLEVEETSSSIFQENVYWYRKKIAKSLTEWKYSY